MARSSGSMTRVRSWTRPRPLGRMGMCTWTAATGASTPSGQARRSRRDVQARHRWLWGPDRRIRDDIAHVRAVSRTSSDDAATDVAGMPSLSPLRARKPRPPRLFSVLTERLPRTGTSAADDLLQGFLPRPFLLD